MNTLGKVKDTDTKETYRQFIINCLGDNDRKKYYSLSPFGVDSNPPEDSRALTTNSQNKDDKFVIGFLNKIKQDDLNKGEKIIFSTSVDGSEIKSYIRFNNDGTIHFNGDVDFLAGFTELKVGFDTAVTDLNATITELNKIIAALTAWVVIGGDGGAALKALVAAISAVSSSTASIDDSKKENLKTE